MKIRISTIIGVMLMLLLLGGASVHTAPVAASEPSATFVTGLEGGSGSTIGPDGALYVPETIAGKISRVDPNTGAITTFASGLPKQLTALGIGGIMDVAFIDQTAYALVTLVGSDWQGTDTVGIYRIDAPDKFTVVADIGKWAIDNPPPNYPTGYDTATGVQYAMQPQGNGFIVTDGHHNRVLKVGLDGSVKQLIQFDNIVPTGVATSGNTIYVGQAGPIPHRAADGKIVSFTEASPTATQIAAGAPLLVDVEFGPGQELYALSQGIHEDKPGTEGSPANPNTGSLVKHNGDGAFATLAGNLNTPTSMEFIGDTAYVVTFTGEIIKIENVSSLAASLPTTGAEMPMPSAGIFLLGFAALVLGALLVLKNKTRA